MEWCSVKHRDDLSGVVFVSRNDRHVQKWISCINEYGAFHVVLLKYGFRMPTVARPVLCVAQQWDFFTDAEFENCCPMVSMKQCFRVFSCQYTEPSYFRYKILVGKFEGNRPLERSGHIFEDNIKRTGWCDVWTEFNRLWKESYGGPL